MRLFNRMATSKVSILCEIMQNVIFIRRVPPYHQPLVANFAPHSDYYRGITQLIWTCKSLRITYGWVNKDVLQQKKKFIFPPKIDGKGGPFL